MTAYNNMTPKKTKYKGVIYRSRLEAKWAVVFDLLGIEHTYETSQFSLENTGYMPDFYLPQLETYVEVKGVMDQDSEYKLSQFMLSHNILIVGNFKVANSLDEMYEYMRDGVYRESWYGSRFKPLDMFYEGQKCEAMPCIDRGQGDIAPIWRDTFCEKMTYQAYMKAARYMDWEPIEEVKAEAVKEKFKPEKENREKRTARFQLVTTPTLRDRVDKRAENAKVSRNEFIIQALEYVLSL